MAIFYRFVRRPPQIISNFSKKNNTNHNRSDLNNNNHSYKYSKLDENHNENQSEDTFPMIKVNDDSDSQNIQFKANKVSESVKEAFASHTETNQASNSRYFTSKQVKLIVVSFGFRILITGFLWDKYVHKYHDLLMHFSENPTQRKLQGQAFKSISMWLIMWFWRITNGCALLEHLVIATFF